MAAFTADAGQIWFENAPWLLKTGEMALHTVGVMPPLMGTEGGHGVGVGAGGPFLVC